MRPATGSLKIPVITVRPRHSTALGNETFTETTCIVPPDLRGSYFPERAREPEGVEVGDQHVLGRARVLPLQFVPIDGYAQRVGLLDRERRPGGPGTRGSPIVQMSSGLEEHHVVRARVHDVVPPLRRGEGQEDERLRRRARRPTLGEFDPDWSRAMMTAGCDPNRFVQHRVERYRVPCAVREERCSVRSLDTEGGRDGGEWERHQDSLRPRHELQMARSLERLQRLERLWAAELKSLHNLLQDLRDGVLHERVEDELPDVSREVCPRCRHLAPRARMKQEGR